MTSNKLLCLEEDNKHSGKYLRVVYREIRSDDSEVCIRWCTCCGAVVGDVDIDNRTAPGRLFKLTFPNITEEYFKR